MAAILTILAIWLLLNAFFVVAAVPPRTPKKYTAPFSSHTKFVPVMVDREARTPAPEEKLSISLIVSVAMGAFFVLVRPILDAVDAVRRALRRMSPPE